MVDDQNNSDPASNQPANQSTNSQQAQTQSSQNNSPPDNTKLAEELGKLKAENEALKTYQQKVEPVIQTIWSDEALLKQATEVHNKRLGITPEEPEDDQPLENPEDVKITNKVNELRNSEVSDKINNFYVRHGVDKLDDENKKNINIKVGTILMEMLDPMNNKKDLKEVLEDVPLLKLDKFLEDAYYLATKNDQKQEESSQSLGIIGSLTSQSINPDSLTLSEKERKVASQMGISEEKFLARKKEIATRRNSIY